MGYYFAKQFPQIHWNIPSGEFLYLWLSWVSNMKIPILFFFLLSFPTHITQTLCGVYGWSAHQMTALLSEMCLFWVRGACELRSASYGLKHASRFLCDTPFCAYIHTQLKNWRSYTCKDILPIDWLLYSQRYLFCDLQLYVRFDRQVMPPNTHHNLFPMWHFVHNYTDNWKTTSRISIFYISNDCCANGDVYFLC